jgi:hypothetical protein
MCIVRHWGMAALRLVLSRVTADSAQWGEGRLAQLARTPPERHAGHRDGPNTAI